MPATRSSARLSGVSASDAQPDTSEQNELKRKAPSNSTSPQAKRGRKDATQKTLEETIPDDDLKNIGDSADNRGQPESPAAESESHAHHKPGEIGASSERKEAPEDQGQETAKPAEADGLDGTIKSFQARGQVIPSNILEKGIIYFFARARVGISDPGDVKDIARSYIVLRPLPKDAKLTEGAIEDLNNNRLLAVPKKVLPKSHQDAFMVFVEKTTGISHSPPVTPIAEGVYAITTQGRDSHLAYMLTIPHELGQVQKSLGLKGKGSFVLSAKNPEQKGPANAALPQGPGFPQDIMEGFQGRRWMGLLPHHLDYANAQCLFIGEGAGEFRRAGEKSDRDEQDDTKSPEEEIQDLEGEDAHRTQALNGDDTIFEDLGISQKEYPKVKTTW